MNILEIAQSFSFDLGLKKVGSSDGGEWAGACPACGGETPKSDRFHLWPFKPGTNGGRYWCRQCGAQGDVIQFARDFITRGNFRAACELVGVQPQQPQVRNFQKNAVRGKCGGNGATSAPTSWTPKREEYPCDEWRRRAAFFLAQAQKNLDTPASRAALTGRCLTMETARSYGIGWNPSDRYESPALWGLPEGKKIWLPAGLVVSIGRGSLPVTLKIRRRDWNPDKPDNFGKWPIVRGSRSVPLGLGDPLAGQPVVVVESETDAILIVPRDSFVILDISWR